MFLKIQLSWNVSVPAENLDAEGKMLEKAILVRLLDEFATKKAFKDLGYFIAVTILTTFSCITFKMFPGEILEGVAHKILKHGMFLRCGPAEKVHISHHKMAGYEYFHGESPCFRNDKSSKIEKGSLVRFMVIADKYDEAERDFRALVSLEGDYLGPVS